MAGYCDDCGSKVYGGRCVNCHESTYIEEQYLQDGEPVPVIIRDEAAREREHIERNKGPGQAQG